MILRIPAGRHRARPFRFGLWWNRSHFSWIVKFDESCRYDLGTDDQYDVNKLVGIGYLWHHHKNSARFGWRYWTDRKEIELSAYCYVNGRRVIQHVCFCEIGKEYVIRLKVLAMSYYFEVVEKGVSKPATAFIEHYHTKKFCYRLGTFFGGQTTAQHDTIIELKKLG